MTSKRRAPRAIRLLLLANAALVVVGIAGTAAGLLDLGLPEALRLERDRFDGAMSDTVAVACLIALLATLAAGAFAWFDRRLGYLGLAAGLALFPALANLASEVSIRGRPEILFDDVWSAASYALLTLLVIHLWTTRRMPAQDAAPVALEPARS